MNKFKVEKNFLVRIPYCSYNVFENDLCSMNRKDINGLLNKLKFNENLLASSIDLYRSIHDENNKSDVYESCLKYLIRASTRCTPYGLNSAVMRGSLDEYDDCIIDNYFYKYAKPDMDWLVEIIKMSEKKLSGQLKVTLNNTLEYNILTIEKLWNSYYCTESSIGGKVIINYTNAVKEIFSLCSNQYISINDIILKLTEKYPNMAYEFLFDFIMRLLNKEFIISDLRPCLLVVDQYGYLLMRLKEYKIDGNYLENLIQIEKMFEKYNNIQVSKGETVYTELINEMSKLYQIRNYIALDMFQNKKIKINKNKLSIIEEFSNFMISWGLIDTYGEYINNFLEKYGNQAVKYTDLINPQIGLGEPIPDKRNTIILKDNFNIAFLKILTSQVEEKVIDICQMKNHEYIETNENISFQLALIPLVMENRDEFLISPLAGAKGLNKLDGRFKYLFGEDLIKDNKNNNIVNVEITYPSCLSRHANVQMTIPTSKYVLEYGTKTKDELFERINLEDIYVFVDSSHKIRFIDNKSKKILTFTVSSAYNQMYCPFILKPLLDLSDRQFNAVFTLYNEFIHLISKIDGHFPRIVYKNIIIIPESWKIDNRFINSKGYIVGLNDFLLLFDEFANENNIPNIITVGPFDQKMTLNIKEKDHLKILYNVIKNDLKTPLFESVISKNNLYLMNSNNEPYVGEFIFNISNSEKFDNKQTLIDIPFIDFETQCNHSYSPFDKWISLKLYMEKSMNNNVIREQVYELHNNLIKKQCIDNFFFIRYEDPCQHIRLRIKFKPKYKRILIEEIDNFIMNLKKDNIINNCVIDTYVQEYSRYGGHSNIELAEKLFMYDSLTTINILRQKKQKMIKMDIKNIYILSSFRILLDMNISLDKQVEYLSDYILDKNEIKKFREFPNINYLQEIIDDNMMNLFDTQENINLMTALEERSMAARDYWKSVSSSDLNESRKKQIICSILHMHFNRMIGIDRTLENQLISYLRKMIYIKYNKMKFVNSN